jgi:hypothetical protein
MFESKHGPYLKVGHFKGKDAWDRVKGRWKGFRSCICPADLVDRVDVKDLKLVAWYPELTSGHERVIHRQFERVAGEWHYLANRDDILDKLTFFANDPVWLEERKRAYVGTCWTKEEKAEYVRLCESGLSLERIAKSLRRAQFEIGMKFPNRVPRTKRLKEKFLPGPKTTRGTLKEEKKAKEEQTLKEEEKRTALERTACRWTLKEDERLTVLAKSGISIGEAARKLGRTTGAVGVRLRKLSAIATT